MSYNALLIVTLCLRTCSSGGSFVLCREASYSSIYNTKFSFYSQLINKLYILEFLSSF